MHTKNLVLILLTVFLISLSGCKPQAQKEVQTKGELKYAKIFDLDNSSNAYTKLTVFNPWNDYSIHSIYYLTNNEETETPSDGMKVITPVKTVMVNSATHLGFLSLLGELDKVKGVCNAKYVYNLYILEGVESGTVKDLGDSFNLDTEQLLMLNPQIIFTTAYNGDQKEAETLKRLNQNPIFNLEWQESSLLGRAEWIKFIGAFFNKSAQADSIFNDIEANYLTAKQIANHVSEKPSILSGQDFRGTWSLPSGNSYAAQLFKDAKVAYYYEDEVAHQGSIPSSIEEAMVYFHNADLWVNVQAKSLEELEQNNDKYKLFKAFKEGNVYSNNKRSHAEGGNDYWESGVARPDLLLKDLIKVAHPSLLPEYELTYMRKLD